MLRDTVTLALDGDVPLDDFADALDGLRDLIGALSKQIAKGVDIDWFIDGLEIGSATATARGESQAPHFVEQVVAAYLSVGRAEARHELAPFSHPVRKAVASITGVLNGRITAIRFETADGEATIRSPEATTHPQLPPTTAYGAITGRVQTLSSRGSLRFTLYELIHDKAVSCYLEQGREETMRGAWGRMATVEGLVTRDALTGRPLSVRQITDVQIRQEVEPGSYSNALGAVPGATGAESPEAIIRRMRDGW